MIAGPAGSHPPEPADPSPTVGDVGERRLLAMLTAAAQRVTSGEPGSGMGGDIVIGSGDDAAVIDTAGPAVVSTDTAVEGRHFRFAWTRPRDIGARAVVQSAADIAAMGGRVTGVVVSLGCPPATPVDTLLALNDGILDAAHGLGARVLGGDLVAAADVIIGVTAIGALDGRAPVVLSGARPGDLLAVSGPLGAGAAGLALLLDADTTGDRERLARYADMVAAFTLPAPDHTQGVVAARHGAHAMTDVSDGLIEELITMSAASGARLGVDSALVPRRPGLASVAAELGADERAWVIAGGEDHELLAAFGPGDVPPGWTVIGRVDQRAPDAAGGAADVRIDGAPPDRIHGWQSFGEVT